MNDFKDDKFVVVIQILGQMLYLMEEKHTLLKKKELLSPADVMVLFNRSARTINRWTKKGILKSVEINGTSHYRWDDVYPLIELKNI